MGRFRRATRCGTSPAGPIRSRGKAPALKPKRDVCGNLWRGCSLRRLSGAGCENEGDVPFLPTTKLITRSPVDPLSTEFDSSFLPSFSHRDEAATPGFYRVGLNPGTRDRIGAELTATTRAGI